MDQKSVFIECTCCSHMIQLESFEENKETTEICYWEYGIPQTRSWGNRLRSIWKIITTGLPFSDQIILNSESRQKLIDVLQKHEIAYQKSLIKEEVPQDPIYEDDEITIHKKI